MQRQRNPTTGHYRDHWSIRSLPVIINNSLKNILDHKLQGLQRKKNLPPFLLCSCSCSVAPVLPKTSWVLLQLRPITAARKLFWSKELTHHYGFWCPHYSLNPGSVLIFTFVVILHIKFSHESPRGAQISEEKREEQKMPLTICPNLTLCLSFKIMPCDTS